MNLTFFADLTCTAIEVHIQGPHTRFLWTLIFNGPRTPFLWTLIIQGPHTTPLKMV